MQSFMVLPLRIHPFDSTLKNRGGNLINLHTVESCSIRLKLPVNPVRQKRSRSSTSYLVPYMEVTCASFHSSQVPFHTWCHVWEWHLRRSVFRKFEFIDGAIYGSYMCVPPYITSSNSYMVPYMAMRCASFRISQVSIHTWCHIWHHVW